ncbi:MULTISPECIES: LysR family transcriptional regulator [Xanthomonas]|uniref:LysR family transcriptional regulator n=1 Tax=Xanthomonas cucurbitae TaxID=56453 RepID=A0A2S7DV16_9XANT|nr:LysR family transcriptional regulator [Xanthomonas cucurbitae]PPU77646.1 LysR family transcriptional regulator [Xanthomonas cucurbitae]QHG88131.1 LysR family transcriptional regulator [Xanthomonas cucurbitae]WDM66992.1 LysR family transcriptional regulator [Xanthomonas cucurbitae]WDM70870.1 LysR family transcriptional regulator [Xanthomonas cucurbitae]WDM74695.1 LysR family transcriptional regulator [Xanthomonas cucurbitae]
MDLASLAAFVAIADSGSFSAAAESLHLTQPAVSKRIALLEAQLSARLFDRLGRQVVLTEAGQALLPRAQRVLAELEDARRVLEHLGAAVGGRLSLATSHHVGLHRLPAVLRNFAAQQPQAALDIRFLDSELAYAAVLRGEVELAVTTLAPDTRAPLRAQRIWHDRLQVVVAPDHPLAAMRAVALEDVVAHPAVLPDAGTFTHRIVADLLAAHGLAPRLRMTTNYLETIKMLVSVGLAWSVLPERMIDHQVVALPVADVVLSRELGCVTHGGRTLSRAAQAFVALLSAQAERP